MSCGRDPDFSGFLGHVKKRILGLSVSQLACAIRGFLLRAWRSQELRSSLRKAMALNQEERYASCQELADEIEHYLADEPVEACPGPIDARAGRFIRQHQVGLVRTAAALVVAFVM